METIDEIMTRVCKSVSIRYICVCVYVYVCVCSFVCVCVGVCRYVDMGYSLDDMIIESLIVCLLHALPQPARRDSLTKAIDLVGEDGKIYHGSMRSAGSLRLPSTNK